ncbi:MAG: hypothetical protein N3B21_00240 [Clostridia bacterium]|nr:hypothetical protein [Clostridia bacterium]
MMKKLLSALGVSVILISSMFSSSFAELNWSGWDKSPTTGVKKAIREVYNPAGKFYVYAPAAVKIGDTEHYWVCRNRDEGIIKDSIFYFVRGQEQNAVEVLSPGSAGSWDSMHVCDPSVVAGEFTYNNKAYKYAMFYTGNDKDASLHNQIGVAFSEDLLTWTKYSKPIVTFSQSDYWGVGQPSATSVERGRVLLFYTRGDSQKTATLRREINLGNITDSSDVENHPIKISENELTTDGLTDFYGKPGDYLNNIDVAYDPKHDTFYAVREQHPYSLDEPSFIGVSLQIVSIPAANVWGGGGSWSVEGRIDPNLTGFKRNHNAAIEKTLYGSLPDSDKLRVVFSDSSLEGTLESPENERVEWSYDLWEVLSNIVKDNRNLLMDPDAKINGNAGDWSHLGIIRGSTYEIIYDPYQNRYKSKGAWNEYGVPYNANLGKIGEDKAFYWTAEWPSPIDVNYISLAGSYPNQPQTNTMWKIEIHEILEVGGVGTWVELKQGKGGWIDGGIFEWGGINATVRKIDAFRVKVYSDGIHDVISPVFRGRGGISYSTKDIFTAPKAALIQHLEKK